MSTTPMMQHYLAIKEKNPDHIIFYRLGDFYELFFEDAQIVASQLNLTLTKRGQHQGQPIPMAGVPHHCADNYIARLLKLGHSIAICDQVTDARKGPVERAITRIITPGTLSDEHYLAADQSSRLASIVWHTTEGALCILDISNGHMSVMPSDNLATLIDEIHRMGIKELLIHEDSTGDVLQQYQTTRCKIVKRPPWEYHISSARRVILEHFKIHTLEAFGIEDKESCIIASSIVLNYLTINHIHALNHIHTITCESLDNIIILDQATREHLELTEAQSGNKAHTLLGLFSPSYTPMGLRLITQWMLKPTAVHADIQYRQQAILYLAAHHEIQHTLTTLLSSVPDLERITSRIALHSATPLDIVSVARCLELIPSIQDTLASAPGLLDDIHHALLPLDGLITHIDHVLISPPPSHRRDGGYIQPSSDPELYELWSILHDIDALLKRIEQEEKEATQLPLTIHYSKLHGFYISLPRAVSDKAPTHYKRTQTLKNEERFTIEVLQNYERKILTAREAMLLREKECFNDLLHMLTPHIQVLKKNAHTLAILDALLTFTRLSKKPHYHMPVFEQHATLVIEHGVHPVIEHHVEHFVANDIHLENDARLMILTGPNMGGKSTYMRQTALLALMAYMGSYVPAASMRIGPLDKIMTRIGARDDISKGQSTFMMEMIETAHILHHATPHTLVLIDEIGRGTSTEDGLAIAYATLCGLLHQNRSLTLFATHYFELTQCDNLPGAFNAHVEVKESQGDVIFMHRILPGAAHKSYGLHVAKISGVPYHVLDTAYNFQPSQLAIPHNPQPMRSEKHYAVLDSLRALTPDAISPLEAHRLLATYVTTLNT